MDYLKLAKEVLKKKGDVNEAIKDVSKANRLGQDQQQRLVEVVNIQAFLAKLKNGTQSEDFDLATPIAPENTGAAKAGNGDILKTASLKEVGVPDSYFIVCDEVMPVLPKIAASGMDDYIYEDNRDKIAKEALEKVASNNASVETAMCEQQITDVFTVAMVDAFKNDQALIKTAIAYAQSSGNTDMVDLLMMDTNLTNSEIMQSNVSDDNLIKFATKKKRISKDVKKALITAGVVGASTLGLRALDRHQEVGDKRIANSAQSNQYRRKE